MPALSPRRGRRSYEEIQGEALRVCGFRDVRWSLQPFRAMSNVLLVDDDLENQWALQLALESRGHYVELAANGRDALAKAAAHFPELVITDLQMPEWTAGSFAAA